MFTIKVKSSISNPDSIHENYTLEIDSPYFKNFDYQWDTDSKFSSIPLINAHDHLIGNWYPRSGINAPYINSHIWVEENKTSPSVLERNKIWVNDGNFDFLNDNAQMLVKLGAYKNLFSAVSLVQDHATLQSPEYYDIFPIEVLREYAQCHSLTLGNWWGGNSAEQEMQRTHGKIPFIIHLAEGLDKNTQKEFTTLKKGNLLKSNTLIVHGICLSKDELKDIKKANASLCWCPCSNLYLIGKTMDIKTALELDINITLGTDSTLTGSINLFEEIRFAHKLLPDLSSKILYKMITTNAYKALYVNQPGLTDPKKNILIMTHKKDNCFDNIIHQEFDDIQLMVQKGIPVYGDISFMEYMKVDESDYSILKIGNKEKFVLGHPEILTEQIDNILGYHKKLPYIPWS